MRKGGGKKKRKDKYEYWNEEWKANPRAMTIITAFYLVMCLLLAVWCAYIFVRVLQLGRRQHGAAIRTVLHLTANVLATPAFAAGFMLAGYLAWGSWTWLLKCEPFSSMRNLNFTNAMMLTMSVGLMAILWIVGSCCELSWYLRRHRQDDIPLTNLAPQQLQGAVGRLSGNNQPGGGGLSGNTLPS